MKKKICFFFFGIISGYLCSQSFNFEKQYEYARSLSGKNPDSSEIVLNQLIEHAQKDNQPDYLAKAYYLKAFNSYLKSDAKKTLELSDKALHISQQNNNPVGKALAYRIQGTQYAKLGLLKEASECLNKAISELKNNTSEEGNEVRGMIYNSFLILLNQNEYDKKEYYAEKAIREYQKLRNISRRNELLVSAYTNMGYSLSEIHKFNESKMYFQKAIALVGNENHYMKCSILHDIGFSFSQQGQPDSAVSYYQKALEIANNHSFNEKRIEITRNLGKAYEALNNKANVQKYKLENLKLKDSIAYNQKMAINSTLSNKEKSFDEKLDKSYTLSKGLFTVCFILILSTGIFLYNNIQLRKKHRNIVTKVYQQGITPASYKEDPMEIADTEHTANEDSVSKDSVNLSPAVEEKILKGLQSFEKDLGFNHKNISRYNLANNLNINTKYLSWVIKKHKNFSFNQYINHLRINYIVDMLKNEPQYRKYKINHLAELTGYSSHSAFSLEFKKIIGVHPSAFIKTLDSLS